MATGKLNAGGNPAIEEHPIQGGDEILLVTSCYRNWNKCQPDESLDSYTDFTFSCMNVPCLAGYQIISCT